MVSKSASAKGVASSSDPRIAASNYKFDELNPSNDYLIQKFDNGQGTDWFHAVFKPAPLQSHTISASGANDKNSYYTSMSYLNQQGTLIETYFKRVQARVNTVFNIKDHFRVGENANMYYTLSPNGDNNGRGSIPSGNQSEGNSISEIYRIEPQIPIYDIAGNYGGTYAGPTQLGNAVNPVATQERQKYNEHKTWNIEGTAFAEADFLKHFTIRTAFSGKVTNTYHTDLTFRPYDSGEGHGNSNGYSEFSQYNNYYNWSNTINYNQVFGKHSVKFLGGYEQKQSYARQVGASVVNLPSMDPNFVSISNGTATSAPYSGTLGGVDGPDAHLSLFARADYIYNDRYILAATIRRDGSSRFADGQNYGTFPSVSLAWRISQEDFLKSTTWLNDLKLRGSYGTLGYEGNVPVTNPFTLFNLDKGSSFYDITGSGSSTQQGFFNSSIGNSRTSWEVDKISNVGIDGTFFNKLDVSAEYYVKKSSHLLFSPALPATTGGAGAPAVNVGEVQNTGVDISLNYRDRITTDLSFNVGVNFTSYKNLINSLPGGSFTSVGSRIGDIARQTEGHPIGSFYGYDVIGYFASAADVAGSPTQADAAPGRFKYKDLNGDNKITDADRDYFGDPNPNFTYGLNVGANYKGFDFSMIFYGSQGNDNFNYVKYWTNFYSSLTGNKGNDLLFNSWTPSNLSPKAPIAEAASNFSTSGVVNSYYVENGSFLKCRVAQLGYTFGAGQLRKVGVDRLNVYVQATNLFTITDYTGLDPELQAVTNNSSGVDFGNYPSNERKFILGVRLSF
jgi:TonB-linked SusC/RagA family outer membrane protein